MEQIKADLDYLKLTRAGEVFAELAEAGETNGTDHLEFLATVPAAEVDHRLTLCGSGPFDASRAAKVLGWRPTRSPPER